MLDTRLRGARERVVHFIVILVACVLGELMLGYLSAGCAAPAVDAPSTPTTAFIEAFTHP